MIVLRIFFSLVTKSAITGDKWLHLPLSDGSDRISPQFTMNITRFSGSLGLILVPVLAFYMVVSLQHPLICDLMTQAFPWRFFIGECLRNHQLPLWNPYQHLGYPIHADPQSGAWYLPVWIIGYFFRYTMASMVAEYLLHIILAGFGMRYLAKRLGMQESTALMLGMAYACSGFFVGHSQHLQFMIAATWTPFVLGTLIRITETQNRKDALLLPVFLWLLLSGGYPGIIIILTYLISVILVWKFILLIKTKQYSILKKTLGLLVFSLVLTLLLSAPMLVSVYQSLPHITRGAGTSLAQALVCPFSPQCSISFLFPLASVADITFFDTDYSMTNAYFGILPFALFLLSFRRNRPGYSWIFAGFALFCLLASMGSYLPLREFMYHYFPLMDFFRMPGIFRLFVILGFLVAAGFLLDNLSASGDPGLQKSLRNVLILFLFAGIAALIRGSLNASGNAEVIYRDYFLSFLQKPGIPDNLLINSIFFLLLTSLMLCAVLRIKNPRSLKKYLLILTAGDLIIAANLNGPVTVYSEQFNAREIHREMRKLPEGFDAPLYRPVTENREAGLGFQALYLNMNCFYKQPAWDGYNPFALKNYEDLQFKRGPEFEKTILNPPWFLARQPLLKPDLQSFSPAHWSFHMNSSVADTLILLQNEYPGWKVSVNGREVTPLRYQGTFLSIPVSAGDHNVEFVYQPKMVIFAFYLSLVVLCGLLCKSIKPFILRLSPGVPRNCFLFRFCQPCLENNNRFRRFLIRYLSIHFLLYCRPEPHGPFYRFRSG